ncbi:MAG: xanthine dehydrogenase family protein subunit M [Candidatus Aminicenantes bacterium]|nr:MAG: xanthine dehydrogenase family protein subunit M [Candidatus Aminicenantes bacterium]
MKEFKIAQPKSLDQVTSLLSQKNTDYALMAGGTDLLDEIKNKIIAPEVVIDLKSVPDLSTIKMDKTHVSIDAMTCVADLAENPIIRENFPVLVEAALSLASPQLRNVGTVGGNLCQRPRCWYYRDPDTICRKKGGSRCFALRGRNRYHAIFGGGMCYIVHPSDLAPALISLDAEITINGLEGKKNILRLEDFFTLPQNNVRKENVLEARQVLSEIRIPLPKNGSKSTYYKFKERGTWDFAVVSAAISGVISGGVFRDIKIVCGGLAPIPWRLKKAEDFIKGKNLTEEVIKQGAKEALTDARPLEENTYKMGLVEAVLYTAISSMI